MEENLTRRTVRRLQELSDKLGESKYQADARKIASEWVTRPHKTLLIVSHPLNYGTPAPSRTAILKKLRAAEEQQERAAEDSTIAVDDSLEPRPSAVTFLDSGISLQKKQCGTYNDLIAT